MRNLITLAFDATNAFGYYMLTSMANWIFDV